MRRMSCHSGGEVVVAGSPISRAEFFTNQHCQLDSLVVTCPVIAEICVASDASVPASLSLTFALPASLVEAWVPHMKALLP